MDRLHDFEEAGPIAEADPRIVPLAIGDDERRMHVRAYNHWTSLLHGRPFPSVEDLDPAALADLGPHGVLIDFTGGHEDPSIAWLGPKLRGECGLGADHPRTLAEVPKRSLLSRLTDHSLEIIANRAPVGFEAEFVNARGHETMYRGILLPYSSDGEAIDFIFGVINWKEHAAPEAVAAPAAILSVKPPRPAAASRWADGPSAATIAPQPEPSAPADLAIAGATLGEWLDMARESAEALKLADGRSRGALYRALGLAYDFALLADTRADEFAALLKRSKIKRQDRAPMTPVVKLVFGAGYDKARLTEFAAALSQAKRLGLEAGELGGHLEGEAGGLKALVAAERAARRPDDARVAPDDAARAKLREASPKVIMTMEPGDSEFVLLIARRVSATAVGVVGAVNDAALLEKALVKATV